MSNGDTKELSVRQPQQFSLIPQTLTEAIKFSEIIAKTDLVPDCFKGNPGNILVAIQMGLDLGLAPMQALQNIYIVKGRPTVWGDAMLALVKGHRDCEDIQEDDIETIKENKKATCKVKRRGQAWVVRNFSQADATTAGLWSKPGPWKQYPERMLQMRARSWALRDSFPDALKGIQMREEVQDIPVTVTVEPEPLSEPEAPKEPRPDLQTVLDRIGKCKAIPEVENVEAKHLLAYGWDEQEWDVLQQAIGQQKIAIIKKLKAADTRTPAEDKLSDGGPLPGEETFDSHKKALEDAATLGKLKFAWKKIAEASSINKEQGLELSKIFGKQKKIFEKEAANGT